jgi:hypothetical protein
LYLVTGVQTCALPISMVEGQYFITMAVHSRDESKQYHWLERQLSFKVFSLSEQVGVLHLEPTVEVATP